MISFTFFKDCSGCWKKHGDQLGGCWRLPWERDLWFRLWRIQIWWKAVDWFYVYFMGKIHGICLCFGHDGVQIWQKLLVTCYVLDTALETEHIWEKAGKVPAVRTCTLHCAGVIQTKTNKKPVMIFTVKKIKHCGDTRGQCKLCGQGNSHGYFIRDKEAAIPSSRRKHYMQMK